MVQRVLIKSDQILLKDSTDTVVFDTNRSYLKTDPYGSLKAGGYATVPNIYGYSIIENHNKGGFVGVVLTSLIYNYPNSTPDQKQYFGGQIIPIPASSSIRVIKSDSIAYGGYDTLETYVYPSYFNIPFYNFRAATWQSSGLYGRYSAIYARYSDERTSWQFFGNSIDVIGGWSTSDSGYLQLPILNYANDCRSTTSNRTWAQDYGVYFSYGQYPTQIDANTAFMCTQDPVTLSVSVTS
jgi:hypothetical protein